MWNKHSIRHVSLLLLTIGIVSTLAFGFVDRDKSVENQVHSQETEPLKFNIGLERDILISGVGTEDDFGDALVIADLNGDGQMDLAVGAKEHEPGPVSNLGAVYVFFGPLTDAAISAASAPLIILGPGIQESAGSSLAVGDLNADGVLDLAIGAPKSPNGDLAWTGAVHILYGPFQPGNIDIGEEADATVLGPLQSEATGMGIAIGDLDNDGTPDLAVGSTQAGRPVVGEVAIVFGPIGSGPMQLSEVTGLVITGTVKGEEAGDSLNIGDINGDGTADLVVGAPGAGFSIKRARNPNRGGTHRDAGIISRTGIFYGPLSRSEDKIPFDDAGYIFKAPGESEGEALGSGIGIGDIDGDGAIDLAVGGMGIAVGSRVGTGQVSIIKGPLSGERHMPRYNTWTNQTTSKIARVTHAVVSGESSIDRLGTAAAIGDINGDGTADLILGANASDSPNGEKTGTVSVMFGNIFDRDPIPEASGTGSITVFAIIGVVAVVIVSGGFWYLRRKRKAPEAD